MDDIRVLIADAQFLVADALGSALSAKDELAVLTDHPHRATDALHAVDRGHPEVLLVDYWLPDMQGPTAIRELLQRAPEAKAIAMSWFHGPEQVQATLEAGAVGFLPKSVGVAKVAEAIHRAHRGEDPVFGEQLAGFVDSLRARAQAVDDIADRFADLTAREVEILQMLSTGASASALTRHLGITEATARTHITRILRKIEAGSQLEAVTLARTAGLVP
jgi:DNA-binding NarL/FixJ family response regulator